MYYVWSTTPDSGYLEFGIISLDSSSSTEVIVGSAIVSQKQCKTSINITNGATPANRALVLQTRSHYCNAAHPFSAFTTSFWINFRANTAYALVKARQIPLCFYHFLSQDSDLNFFTCQEHIFTPSPPSLPFLSFIFCNNCTWKPSQHSLPKQR
jgi:hypothetical protein